MPSFSSTSEATAPPADGEAAPEPSGLNRPIVLVGLMGAGKTSVGRRLAKLLKAPFVDADEEIVAAAGMSIADIFESFGEAAFRDLERRVVARLLDEPPRVIALGGGAFVDPETRARVKATARSIWLRADLDTLAKRTIRRQSIRPLLMADDPRLVLGRLMEQRHPLYAEADLVVDSTQESPELVAARVRSLLRDEALAA
jgi:shikimate kinase